MTTTNHDVSDLIDDCAYHAYQEDIFKDLHPDFLETYQHENTESLQDDSSAAPTQAPRAPRQVSNKEPDFGLLRPLFGWLSPDIIKSTFSSTILSMAVFLLVRC